MPLAQILERWLGAYGVNVKELEGFLHSIADKLHLPQEWKDAAAVWLAQNSKMDQTQIDRFVGQIHEWMGPNPGYDHNAAADV